MSVVPHAGINTITSSQCPSRKANQRTVRVGFLHAQPRVSSFCPLLHRVLEGGQAEGVRIPQVLQDPSDLRPKLTAAARCGAGGPGRKGSELWGKGRRLDRSHGFVTI